MRIQRLYTIGNLHGGPTYGVEAEQPFGTVDIHGPFSSENQANNYAHELIKLTADPTFSTYMSVKVVKIETPQAGKHIVRNAAGEYEYAS